VPPAVVAELLPGSVLRLKSRRVLQREESGSDGRVALHVFYGEHQITFDDDEVAFGRRLVGQSRFQAEEACAWTAGAARAWADVRADLIELVDSGILEIEGQPPAATDPPRSVLQLIDPAAPMPPLRWKTLEDLCAMTSVDGRQLPVDLLEATLGAGLLAQMVRDPSGRQCGENSLAMFAPALTDPVPTEWRRCPFSGSRFEDARPMNVSALKQFGAGFDSMLGRIVYVRAAFLTRTGRERLDLGGMWLLSWIFFVLPAWTARRVVERASNGDAPEWATALSKTFGGIRMTLQFLLAHGLGGDAEPSAAELLRVTEEAARYLSHTGVCAGTPQMIERTVTAFVSGTGALATPIAELERVLDYGFATAALLLGAAAREARTRLLVAEARLDSDSIARDLADVDQRDGDATNILRRTTELAAVALGVAVDPNAPPLVAAEPLPDPHADLLPAILGVEAAAVRLAAHHQALANAALGVTTSPVLTRRDVALGLAPTPQRLWSDRVAAHLGWIIEEDDDGAALRVAGRRVRLQSPGTCSTPETRALPKR
jgi:hypothetical protein